MSAGGRAGLVIIGAGPAGLAAAWEASLAGRRVTVLESSSSAGGLCATESRGAFRFDQGGHRLVSKRAELVTRVRELLGPALVERERRSVIALNGRRFTYPLVGRELATGLAPRLLARAVSDYAAVRARPPRDEGTFESWVVARFGRTLYELFFGPYTQKLWGFDPRRLSSDWASQRISSLNLADVARRLVSSGPRAPRTYARRYLYPRGGIGVLFDSIEALLRARGVRFEYGVRVRGLERDASGRVVCAVYERGSVDARLACDAVISSAPLQSLVRWVAPDDDAVCTHADALRHRGLRFLDLCLEGPGPLLGATWMYVSDPSLVMTRVQEPAERSPEACPVGRASLMLEVPCDPGDAVDALDDEALAARVLRDLERVGLFINPRVIDAFSVRAPTAYPVYDIGYASHRRALLERVDAAKNVYTIGRQGLFRYLFTDTAMETGFSAARAWLEGRPAQSDSLLTVDAEPELHEAFSQRA